MRVHFPASAADFFHVQQRRQSGDNYTQPDYYSPAGKKPSPEAVAGTIALLAVAVVLLLVLMVFILVVFLRRRRHRRLALNMSAPEEHKPAHDERLPEYTSLRPGTVAGADIMPPPPPYTRHQARRGAGVQDGAGGLARGAVAGRGGAAGAGAAEWRR